MCNAKCKGDCMSSRQFLTANLFGGSCVWVDVICCLCLSGALETLEHVIILQKTALERKTAQQKTCAVHGEVTKVYVGQELSLLFSHYLV